MIQRSPTTQLSHSQFTSQVKQDNSNSDQTRTKKMSIPKFAISILLSALLFLLIFSGVSALGLGSLKTSDVDVLVKRVCTNKVGDCLSEPELDSETSSRRVLVVQKRYISYDTLTRDMVPCGKPGASYYACHPGQANPYSRGCEVITRCARDTKN